MDTSIDTPCQYIIFCHPFQKLSAPELPPLEVVSVNPPSGSFNGSGGNAVVTITFNNFMKSVEIVVDPPLHHCVRTYTKLGEKIAIWGATWSRFLTYSIGGTLTVSDTDIYGQELEGFEPIIFRFGYPDTTLPSIVGMECDHGNGAVEVGPKKYPKKIIITFSSNMGNVEVVSTHPEFPFTEELDSNILTISFLDGYTMPYNTRFTIELSRPIVAANPVIAQVGFS